MSEIRIGAFEAKSKLGQLLDWVKAGKVTHRRGPWRNAEAVEFATLEWVDWFNHHRLLEPISYIPPAEAEARYYAQTLGLAIVA
jgi:putative transposase